MQRREFFTAMGLAGWSLGGWGPRVPAGQERRLQEAIMGQEGFPPSPVSKREFLEACVLQPETLNEFLSGRGWALFDPDLGFRHNNSTHKTGLNGALCFSRYEVGGERKVVNWPDRPCRIHTYGNSFTNCAQVSDGETWQEYLAAHLGEPVRNFGIGGTGVYQAYRRILKIEQSSRSAEYLILNIWNDDHTRSLHKCRWFTLEQYRTAHARRGRRDPHSGWPEDFHESPWFHANPWPYVHIDVRTGDIVEKDNPYPTPESLFQLCDPEHVYESFKDDLSLEIILALKNGRFSRPEMAGLCRRMGVEGDPKDPVQCRRMADALYRACGFKATRYTLEKIRQFASDHGKKLMVMLSYNAGAIARACGGEVRADQVLVDFLDAAGLPTFDSWQAHREDFRNFRMTPGEYVDRFYIGHYSPVGNHFFAHAARNTVVSWLDPKPPAYRPLV